MADNGGIVSGAQNFAAPITAVGKFLSGLNDKINPKAKPATMSPNYAQSMYAGEAVNRGVAPAKKAVSAVKKPVIGKDKSGKKGYAPKAKVKDSVPTKSTKAKGSVGKALIGKKAAKPSSSGHATVAQDGKIKSRAAKGKAADKMVAMKKFVKAKKA
jgi:hypothetical protein